MIICTLGNLSCADNDDFCYEDATFEKMLSAWRAQEQVAVLEVEVPIVDGDPQHAYYNVALSDGTILYALSGYHLNGIENWPS